eukprot:6930093-Prymnesium_polylepis.1
MRELRGAGMVTVELVPTEINPADIFTKILSRQVFERHHKTVLNLTDETAAAAALPEHTDEHVACSRGGSVAQSVPCAAKDYGTCPVW